MTRYILYNDDVEAAAFDVNHSLIVSFTPTDPRLLPMQLVSASAEGFTISMLHCLYCFIPVSCGIIATVCTLLWCIFRTRRRRS